MILQEPPLVCASNRSVSWLVSVADPATEFARVKIYFNGVLTQTQNISPFFAIFTGVAFMFDVRAFCEDALNSAIADIPQTISKKYNEAYFQVATDQSLKVDLVFEYYKYVAGVETLIDTDSTNSVYVFTARAQQQDSQDLSPFWGGFGGAYPYSPLTYRTIARMGENDGIPTVSWLDSGYFVSFIRISGVDRFQIRLYDANGGLLNAVTRLIPPPTDDFDVYTIGISPENLQAVAWAGGAVLDTINGVYTFIEVQLRAGTGIVSTYRIRKTASKNCQDKLTLWWQNSFGGFEYELIPNNYKWSVASAGDTVRTPAKYNLFEPTPADRENLARRGLSRRNVQSERRLVFTVGFFEGTLLGFHNIGIQRAGRTYIREREIADQIFEPYSNNLVPTVIADSDTQYSDKNRKLTLMDVSLRLAHPLSNLD